MVVAASASSPDDVSKEARSILRSLKSFVANPTDARTVHESLARGFKALHRSLAGIQKGLSAAAEAAPRGRRKEAVVHGGGRGGASRSGTPQEVVKLSFYSPETKLVTPQRERAKQCLLMLRKLLEHLRDLERQARAFVRNPMQASGGLAPGESLRSCNGPLLKSMLVLLKGIAALREEIAKAALDPAAALEEVECTSDGDVAWRERWHGRRQRRQGQRRRLRRRSRRRRQAEALAVR